jgi:hypothetical protein
VHVSKVDVTVSTIDSFFVSSHRELARWTNGSRPIPQ